MTKAMTNAENAPITPMVRADKVDLGAGVLFWDLGLTGACVPRRMSLVVLPVGACGTIML